MQLQFQARQVKPGAAAQPGIAVPGGADGPGASQWGRVALGVPGPRITYFKMQEPIPTCVVWDKRNQNPLIRLFAETLLQELGRQGRQLD